MFDLQAHPEETFQEVFATQTEQGDTVILAPCEISNSTSSDILSTSNIFYDNKKGEVFNLHCVLIAITQNGDFFNVSLNDTDCSRNPSFLNHNFCLSFDFHHPFYLSLEFTIHHERVTCVMSQFEKNKAHNKHTSLFHSLFYTIVDKTFHRHHTI